MSEEMMVENVMSVHGLRRVHVMSNKVIDAERWIEKMVPAEVAEGDLEVMKQFERDIRIYHLWLHWHAREMMFLEQNGSEVVMGMVGIWWIGKGERASWAIDLAATMYRILLGRFPWVAWIRKMPKGATDEVKVADVAGKAMVKVEAAEWVPEGFVVVGYPGSPSSLWSK